jgi:hypothetical protein
MSAAEALVLVLDPLTMTDPDAGDVLVVQKLQKTVDVDPDLNVRPSSPIDQ